MKAISLFSGIGGFDIGLERAGIEVVLQVEIDEFCRKVLTKHWPKVRKIADVRDVTSDDCAGADLIFGGFPCQPVSHAGRRAGEGDDRWLWPEMLRLIRAVMPPYVLAENVYGLVTHDNGALLATVLSDLEDAGYEVAPPVVFPACAVGAVHRRDRVWICAHSRHDNRRSERGQQQAQRAEVINGVRQEDEGRPTSDYDHGHGAPGWTLRPRRTPVVCRDLANHDGQGRALPAGSAGQAEPSRRQVAISDDAGLWLGQGIPEPEVDRVVDGLPSGLDRAALRALGNAVYPAAAEYIGRKLLREVLL